MFYTNTLSSNFLIISSIKLTSTQQTIILYIFHVNKNAHSNNYTNKANPFTANFIKQRKYDKHLTFFSFTPDIVTESQKLSGEGKTSHTTMHSHCMVCQTQLALNSLNDGASQLQGWGQFAEYAC